MKNRKAELIPAGRWQLTGVTYGRAKCACCGRPIRYLYHLKNTDHSAHEGDHSYNFPEEIIIGCVCGPDVFKKSCEGFYSDPAREWNRQYAMFKEYVKYIVLNVRNKDIWEIVPEDLRKPVDEFLESGYKNDKNSGRWWRIRNAKSYVLKTARDKQTNIPIAYYFKRRVATLYRSALRYEIVEENADPFAIAS